MLSGLLVFADKIIDTETAKHVKEIIMVTKIERLWYNDGWEAGIREGTETGFHEGIHAQFEEDIKILIDSLKSFKIPDNLIAEQLMTRYQLSGDEANALLLK